MFLIKKILQHEPTIIFETGEPGSYTKTVDAGVYEISLVGAGGGGVYWNDNPGTLGEVRVSNGSWLATGGVGSTSVIRKTINEPTSLSISIGTGGTSYSGENQRYLITGGTGGSSVVTCDKFTLTCNGGTGGTMNPYSSGAWYGNPTAGVYGGSVFSGIATNEIVFNGNDHPITSRAQWSKDRTGLQPGYVLNDNFVYNTAAGQGGYGFRNFGDSSNKWATYIGGHGYVIIKRL